MGTTMKIKSLIRRFGLFILLCTLCVKAQNQTPIAKIDVAGKSVISGIIYHGDIKPGDVLNFIGSGSIDSAKNPLTYKWDFGDGTTSTQPNPSHSFTQPGKYYVRLTVDDGKAPIISSTLFNKTPATLGTPPTGWKVLVTQDFESGSVPSAQWISGAISTTSPHSGSKGLMKTVDGNGSTCAWNTALPAGTKEVYISYWEFLDSIGRMNTEMFVGRFWINNPFQEIIMDRFNNFFGQLNSIDGRFVVEPQGVYYHNYSQPSDAYIGFDSKWHQFEIRYRPNTTTCSAGCNDGIFQMWKDGVTMFDLQNVNLNGSVKMSDSGMNVEAGGDYSLNVWFKSINGTPVTSCPSQPPAANSADCANSMGEANSIECNLPVKFNFNGCRSGGPFPIPVFNRYIDDIIVLIPSN